MRYNLADLHMHSFCSDGLRTPTQAVEEACAAGLQAMSLTDHDTVEGIPEATAAGERLGMEVVPGTELSAHVRDREVHILAYCIDCSDDQLGNSLEQSFASRHERGVAIVEKLNVLGLSVSLDDVLSQAKGSPLGRPHIAAAMVENGLVADKDEAFNRYIGDRGPAFKPKPYTAAETV
ncbi:MAG: PHP domain-containing protein, partial [Candidatus Latescibacteria bacterium]|nr:PHP domain-containing protein [Candidatus Latescibacterota bacterium]